MGRATTHDRVDSAELLDAVRNADDPRVRISALGALIRTTPGPEARDGWLVAAHDSEPAVRRRAAELAPTVGTRASVEADGIAALIDDPDQLVAEAGCFAAGEIEWAEPVRTTVVTALLRATGHEDALIREAAVAALGSVGDARGLDAILAACTDRPTVRRRAILALAPFDDPRVDAAIATARGDSDWQTRQAAEDLSDEGRA